ncbi:MAG: Ser-Thr-rich GPI-anchored membrane family protein, partial [Patescibacteria group bacterium]
NLIRTWLANSNGDISESELRRSFYYTVQAEKITSNGKTKVVAKGESGVFSILSSDSSNSTPELFYAEYISGKDTASVYGNGLSNVALYFDSGLVDSSKYTYISSSRISFFLPTFESRTYPIHVRSESTESGKKSNTVYLTLAENSTGNTQHPSVSLSASPPSITAGQPTRLTWSSSNVAGGCEGNAPDGKNSGSQVFYPTQTTTYSATCYEYLNHGGRTASASVTVTVSTQSAAPSVTLRATPSSIIAGQSSALLWNASNSNSCVGTNFNTSDSTAGDRSVAPTQTTTYRVTCYEFENRGGRTATENITVNVSPVDQSPTAQTRQTIFTASETTIDSQSFVNFNFSSQPAFANFKFKINCSSGISLQGIDCNQWETLNSTVNHRLIYFTNTGTIQSSAEVRLAVFDSTGAQLDTKVINVYVNPPPTATPPATTQSYIQVSDPNGGESFDRGQTVRIAWNHQSVGSNIHLWLRRGSSNYVMIATNQNVSSGEYFWNIPSAIPTGTSYKIRLFATSNDTGQEIYDDSDASFRIR